MIRLSRAHDLAITNIVSVETSVLCDHECIDHSGNARGGAGYTWNIHSAYRMTNIKGGRFRIVVVLSGAKADGIHWFQHGKKRGNGNPC